MNANDYSLSKLSSIRRSFAFTPICRDPVSFPIRLSVISPPAGLGKGARFTARLSRSPERRALRGPPSSPAQRQRHSDVWGEITTVNGSDGTVPLDASAAAGHLARVSLVRELCLDYDPARTIAWHKELYRPPLISH